MSKYQTKAISDNRFFYEELRKLKEALDLEKKKNEKLQQLLDIEQNKGGGKEK